METYIKLLNGKINFTYTMNITQNEIEIKFNVVGEIESNIQFLKENKNTKIKSVEITFKRMSNKEPGSCFMYLPSLFGTEFTDPKKINGIIYLENDKYDDLFKLIKSEHNIIVQSNYDFDTNNFCDLLLLSESPTGKIFKNLKQQTYILSPEGLYFISDSTKVITKENLVTLPEKVTIEYLWEMLQDQEKFIDTEPQTMNNEQNSIIRETKYQIQERIIEGFRILGGYITQWNLDKTIPEPDNLIISWGNY